MGTFLSAFRFKNITVTAPDGKVLWEGPPAVDSTKATELARPAEPLKPPLTNRDGFVQLFNGVDLAGWKLHPQQRGNWHVENGQLVGSGPASVSHLYSIRDDYTDFHLRAEVRINEPGNSGVYFRTPFGPTWPANDLRFPTGYEAQIYSKPGGQTYTGSLYAGVEAVVYVSVRPVPPVQWCALEVIARGNHIVVKVNGITTADYTDLKISSAGATSPYNKTIPRRLSSSARSRSRSFRRNRSPPFPRRNRRPRTRSVLTLRKTGEGFVPLFNGKDIAGWTAWGSQGRLSKRMPPASGGFVTVFCTALVVLAPLQSAGRLQELPRPS